MVTTEPTAGGLPRPGDLRLWGPGAPTGPGLFMQSMLQVTGLEHAARKRRPMDVHPPSHGSSSSCFTATGNEIPDAGLVPARISFGQTRKRGAGTRNRGNGARD